ncbi:hypothetical protein [Phyllobacterium lublinensis]|uniref:hypothetical protein n=1 Tax=Phyllobacterium lublinensis TaxID=2875708 RepID=UPI001CCF3601|nr:hypothetical protein [Phyllobacterium sp. 2063]MBZ9655178.1 hypothetical protein [Phyllobacterium sp. 2063]
MRNHDIEPLHFRDFMILAALTATLAIGFWATVTTIAQHRQTFDVLPVVTRS